MFIVDVSDKGSLASSWILLMEILANPDSKEKPLAVVFNKTDLCTDVSEIEAVENIMHVDDLFADRRANIYQFSGNCVNKAYYNSNFNVKFYGSAVGYDLVNDVNEWICNILDV